MVPNLYIFLEVLILRTLAIEWSVLFKEKRVWLKKFLTFLTENSGISFYKSYKSRKNR